MRDKMACNQRLPRRKTVRRGTFKQNEVLWSIGPGSDRLGRMSTSGYTIEKRSKALRVSKMVALVGSQSRHALRLPEVA